MSHPKPGQRKKNSQSKTKAESDHLNWVATNPCCICGSHEVQLHHIRILGEPRDHFKTIPLCYDHHQGCPDGLHFMGKKPWREKFGNELDMLAELIGSKTK